VRGPFRAARRSARDARLPTRAAPLEARAARFPTRAARHSARAARLPAHVARLPTHAARLPAHAARLPARALSVAAAVNSLNASEIRLDKLDRITTIYGYRPRLVKIDLAANGYGRSVGKPNDRTPAGVEWYSSCRGLRRCAHAFGIQPVATMHSSSSVHVVLRPSPNSGRSSRGGRYV
jgi:hypothetical protein